MLCEPDSILLYVHSMKPVGSPASAIKLVEIKTHSLPLFHLIYKTNKYSGHSWEERMEGMNGGGMQRFRMVFQRMSVGEADRAHSNPSPVPFTFYLFEI